MLHELVMPLRAACATVVAAVVGAAAYLLLLAALLLALLWAFATRVVFSLYCIFIPRAADSNCCLKLTRNGDFWGLADVQAAFAAAKLFATHAELQQAPEAVHGASTGAGDAVCSVAVSRTVQPGPPRVEGRSFALNEPLLLP
jgi:hypothetical protein